MKIGRYKSGDRALRRERNSKSVLVVGTASLLALQPYHPVVAQPKDDNNKARPVCMARTLADDSDFTIIVPASDAATMKTKDFKTVSCSKVFGTREEREAYRDSVCAMASAWREELQANFEKVRGERPAVLCGMAEAALSDQWKRRGRV